MEEKYRVQRIWRFKDGVEQPEEWTIMKGENDPTRHGSFSSKEAAQELCDKLNSGEATLEPQVIYIARDKSGETFGYKKEPVLHEDGMWDDGNLGCGAVIPDSWFPDIKPGECRKFVMV